jgi:hypothetical protein
MTSLNRRAFVAGAVATMISTRVAPLPSPPPDAELLRWLTSRTPNAAKFAQRGDWYEQ